MNTKPFLLAASLGTCALAEIAVDCDKASHLYNIGEQITFVITSTTTQELNVELSMDGGTVLEKRTVTPPAKVNYSLGIPGFLRCTVTGKGEKKTMAAAAVEPDRILPGLPEPDDFDQFWENAIKEQSAIPENFTMTKLDNLSSNSQTTYYISCANVQNTTVHGWLTLPNTKEKSPLLVYFEGAGHGMNFEIYPQHYKNVTKYLGENVASLVIFSHPFVPGKTTEEHKKLYGEYLKQLGSSYWLAYLDTNYKDNFFYRMILGARRMCNLVSDLPEINKERIVYLGASQGGAFGMYITALCPQIRACFSGVPACGDIGGALLGNHSPQSQTKKFLDHVEILRYFDAANFAKRITVPVFISAGFVDYVCAPSSVYAIANSLGGHKLVFDKLHNGHGDGPEEYIPMYWFWCKQHLGNQ